LKEKTKERHQRHPPLREKASKLRKRRRQKKPPQIIKNKRIARKTWQRP